MKMLTEEFVSSILPMELQELSNYIMRKKDIKIAENEIYAVSRKVVRFYISLIKRTRGTDYYRRYAHTIVRLVETAFKKQNSSVNEMVQHGISIYKGFDMENKTLETFAGGRIKLDQRIDVEVRCDLFGTTGSGAHSYCHRRQKTRVSIP